MNRPRSFVQLARPHQYVKNGFIWLPVFFGRRLHDPGAVLDVAVAFVVFCLAASSVYVLNDLRDAEEDRRHPAKKSRPIAAGTVRPGEAWGFMGALLGSAAVLCLTLLPLKLFLFLGMYLLLNLAYSWGLKHRAVIDVTCIATGFVLRVFAGGAASGVEPSHWLILMTFLLALFLALSKRRDDLILAAQGHNCRKSLDGYNLEFVSLSMGFMASVILVSYILYTVSPEVVSKYETRQLYLTAFWVVLGLLRYMQITFVREGSGSPTLVLLKDGFLQTVLLLWIGSFYLLLYGIGA